MKKLLSVIAAGMTAIAVVPFRASADDEEGIELPFTLSAPGYVTITYLNGEDSLNTAEVSYTQNNSMSSWTGIRNDSPEAAAEELKEMGYEDLWINAQIDWSIDTPDDWKCNDYWLTGGYDENQIQHLGEWAYISAAYTGETANSEQIFRYMGNIDDPDDERWYGAHNGNADYDGWGDVLRDGQYKKVSDQNESRAWIDLSEHTVYVRVRWIVNIRPLEGDVFAVPSEWSDTTAMGMDVDDAEPLKPGDIAPPVISDLRYLDEESNGYPVIGFRLDVPAELEKQTAVAHGTNGDIRVCTEARVQGSPAWAELQGDMKIEAGDIWISLQNISEAEGRVEKDTPIALRAKYYCIQDGQEEFYSDYSDVITFGAMEVEDNTRTIIEQPTEPVSEAETEASAEKKKCSVCGICPHPLGICLFILIAAVLVIAGGIITFAAVRGRKKENTPPSEGPGSEDNGESGKNA